MQNIVTISPIMDVCFRFIIFYLFKEEFVHFVYIMHLKKHCRYTQSLVFVLEVRLTLVCGLQSRNMDVEVGSRGWFWSCCGCYLSGTGTSL